MLFAADIEQQAINWFTNLAIPIAILLLILGVIFWKILIPQSDAHVKTVIKVGATVETIGQVLQESSEVLKTLVEDNKEQRTARTKIVDDLEDKLDKITDELPRVCRMKDMPR